MEHEHPTVKVEPLDRVRRRAPRTRVHQGTPQRAAVYWPTRSKAARAGDGPRHPACCAPTPSVAQGRRIRVCPVRWTAGRWCCGATAHGP